MSSTVTDGLGVRKADLRHILHPLTTHATLSEDSLLMIAAGRGLHVTDVDGRRYLDACSGLWNVNVGYGRDELAEVAAEALRGLGFGMLYIGRGTPAAAMLAERLAGLLPGDLNRFVFTVGGSDGNDTAIKLARRYHHLRGHSDKVGIIARRDSYHGSTYGAMSATGTPSFWEGFGPRVPGVSHIGQPTADAPDAAEELEHEIARLGADTVAAFIAEPVSVPNGVVVPPEGYWQRIRAICDAHDVVLIADEVITGFGRTGRMFGLEHWDVVPDIAVMAKGLTSGYLPLGAVGLREGFAEVISSVPAPLMHGFTAGGHPAACAVALRNIDIIEQEELVANAGVAGAHLKARLTAMIEAGRATDCRGLGLMAAVDVTADADAGDRFDDESVGKRLEQRLRADGVLVRAFGNTVTLAPPLTVTTTDVDFIVDALEHALAEL